MGSISRLNSDLNKRQIIIRKYISCTCDEAYVNRDMVDPSCFLHEHEETIELIMEEYAKDEISWNQENVYQQTIKINNMSIKIFYAMAVLAFFLVVGLNATNIINWNTSLWLFIALIAVVLFLTLKVFKGK